MLYLIRCVAARETGLIAKGELAHASIRLCRYVMRGFGEKGS